MSWLRCPPPDETSKHDDCDGGDGRAPVTHNQRPTTQPFCARARHRRQMSDAKPVTAIDGLRQRLRSRPDATGPFGWCHTNVERCGVYAVAREVPMRRSARDSTWSGGMTPPPSALLVRVDGPRPRERASLSHYARLRLVAPTEQVRGLTPALPSSRLGRAARASATSDRSRRRAAVPRRIALRLL
jgi:hypothetical protein